MTGHSLFKITDTRSNAPFWFTLTVWSLILGATSLFSPFTWRAQLPLIVIGVLGLSAAIASLRVMTRSKEKLVDAFNTLQESESRYRSIFENSSDAMSLMVDGHIVMGNRKCAEMFRVSDHSPVGMAVWDLAPERQPDGMTSEAKAREMDRIALETGEVKLEWRGRRCNGEEFDAEISLVRTELGGRPALNVFLRDLSEAHNLGAQLRRSQAQFFELISAVHEGIGRVDKDEIIRYCNPAYANIFGFARPDELVGRSVSEFLDDVNQNLRQAQLDTLTTGQAAKYEIDIVLANGDEKRLLVSSTPRFDNEGRFDGTLSAVVEVTDLRRAAQEREHLLREKEQRVRELSCLYSVSRLLGQRRDLDAIFRGLAAIIPSGLEHGGHAHARIRYGGREYTAGPVAETPAKLIGEITAEGRLEGLIEVFLGSGDSRGEKLSFQPGERHLVEAIARALGQAIEIIRIEQRLQAATDDWKETFNLMTDAIVIQDANLQTIRINQTARALFHAQERVSEGLHRLLATAPEAEGDYQTILQRAVKSGKPVRVETRDADSNEYYVIYLYPREGEDGRFEGLVYLIHNMTGRVQRDREKRKLMEAVNQSAGMICITDTSGIIEYINPQFTRVTGYEADEVIGRSIQVLQSGFQGPEFYKDLWETIGAGRVWSGRLRNRRKNGEIYWESQKITPIRNEQDEIVNFLAIKEDITPELKATQKIMESDKMAAIGTLAAGVAHEFKNYLGGIIGNASFALDHLADEGALDTARQTLSDIVTIGEQANQVAMSLLTYSKAGTDQFSREDLKKIVDQTAALVNKGLRSRAIELMIYNEGVPSVEIIPGKIQQLLLNLIINAEQAIGKNGVITISLTADDSCIYLKVGDTGNGIPEENLKRVFDPFFSTKGVWGTDEVVGTGMGLAICRNVALEHGGDLTVESVEGIGTTFTLALPLERSYNRRIAAGSLEVTESRILLFTLDKNLVAHYFGPSRKAKSDLVIIDNVSLVTETMLCSWQLAILDARFSGKIELWKMAELCRATQVPYIVVNSGAREYQMADLYQGARACYSGLPDFATVLATISTESKPSS